VKIKTSESLGIVLLFFGFMFLWPAATNVVVLRPHQTKRKPTPVPSLFFVTELAQPPRNIFAIYETTAAKRSSWGLIQLLTSFVDCFDPSYNKE
jgi:hypothetical protein